MRSAVIALSDSSFLREFLTSMGSRGISSDLLILRRRSLGERLVLLWKLKNSNGLSGVLQFLPSVLVAHFRERRKMKDLLVLGLPLFKAIEVCLNWSELRFKFRDTRFDLVLLAHSGIVPASILATWTTPVVNAHPGRLYRWRGVDVVKWSLSFGEMPFVSLHLVDSGIDTGRIIRIVPVPIFPGISGKEIETKAQTVCLELLFGALEGTIDTSENPESARIAPQGPLRRKMPKEIARRLEKKKYFLDEDV